MSNTLPMSEMTSDCLVAPSTQPIKLLDLPPEVLHIVVRKLSPTALSAFSRTSRAVYGYIQGLGDLLWKDIFLSIWDDPQLADEAIMALRVPWFCTSHLADTDIYQDQRRPLSDPPELLADNCMGPTQFRWRDQVQRRTSAEIFLSQFGLSSCVTGANIPARRFKSIDTLLSILETTPSASLTFTRSRNIEWLQKLLSPSDFNTGFFVQHFLHNSDVEPANLEDRQLTAALQVLFFTPQHILPRPQAELSRLNARAYVYNIQNYRDEGWHGPWRMTERGIMEPNWIHLAACQRVVVENLAERKRNGHNYPAPPTGPEAVWGGSSKAMAAARQNNPSRITEKGFDDWAGVEGVWKRIVCFMDYRDFHEYNVHSRRPSGGLDTLVFEHEQFNEATRIITMTLKITKSEPGETPFEHRPTLHFSGFSVANDTMISGVHGFVCMTKSGYVRWRLITRYDTEDRWVTEALGDAGSAAGFLGTWTGINHDIDDPAGPTWLWKVADASQMPQAERSRVSDLGLVFPDVFFGGNVFGDLESDDEEDEDEEEDEGDEDEEMLDSESGEAEDGDESSSDETGYTPPHTLPALQTLSSLFD